MKIGIDGVLLSLKYPCGTKHYAEQLIWALSKVDRKNSYIIFSKENVSIPQKNNFQLKTVPYYIPFLKRQYFFLYLAKKEGVDVFHYLSPTGSIFSSDLAIVTTVHDMDFDQIYPKDLNLSYSYQKYFNELSRKHTFKNTKHFVADSLHTKKQLVTHLSKLKIKRPVTTIALAPNSRFKVLIKIKKPAKNFFLCMGDFSPRKNIPRIMEAYALLAKEIKDKYALKIVASNNAPQEKFSKKAYDLGIEKYISIVKSPKLGHLVKLYNQASIFLYPSLYEGFGIPILEAMACGCPVITSNCGATKETAGNAASLVNPESTKEISEAILEIVKNQTLTKILQQRSLKRAKKFTWEKTARKTLSVYNKVWLQKSSSL